MLITSFLKLLKFDLSGEKAMAPCIDIDSTLLKRIHVGERAPVPPLPVVPLFVSGSSYSACADSFSAFFAQLKIFLSVSILSLRR